MIRRAWLHQVLAEEAEQAGVGARAAGKPGGVGHGLASVWTWLGSQH